MSATARSCGNWARAMKIFACIEWVSTFIAFCGIGIKSHEAQKSWIESEPPVVNLWPLAVGVLVTGIGIGALFFAVGVALSWMEKFPLPAPPQAP